MADGWIGAATMRGMRDPEAQVLRPVLEREITRALDTIPEDFRLIVVLSDVEELSYREIADLVGCPIGTVMSRLHRGRRLLKKQLLEQARNLGIVDDADVDSRPPRTVAEPVALDAYRAKKGAAR
jgi:RNA polymerase sigma-70 factor (ECF subfamily)